MTFDAPGRAEELTELRGLADDIFSATARAVLDVPDTEIPFSPTLWKTLAESGLTLLTTPESDGGSGATQADLAVVIASAAAHAAPVPLAETDLLASWLLRAAGLPVPDAPLTAAYDPSLVIDDHRVTASLDRVPWARAVDALVLANDHSVALVSAADLSIEPGTDLARDPRDRIVVDVELAPSAIGPAPHRVGREFMLRGALGRSIQICGAIEQALELTIEHVGTRQQFGRPLGKFQAVQSLVAESAGAVAMARAATEFAVSRVTEAGFEDERSGLAIAVAKAQTSRSAPIVARNAHQAHGAIGFTLDHRLRHFTLRALAWRSEFGGPQHWEHVLGEAALRKSGAGLWNLVTGLT
ncbi:acyl-CoA dehydrogenase [Nocardia barduliensis]|uniref:acyl-CoA dehydrogenase n=1 Tax=Nocardia barduliensis TaxID=2736643 RepID=UPI00157187B0|nr:acyl-CoA dehydrogenase [Nocardia barduliensis]